MNNHSNINENIVLEKMRCQLKSQRLYPPIPEECASHDICWTTEWLGYFRVTEPADNTLATIKQNPPTQLVRLFDLGKANGLFVVVQPDSPTKPLDLEIGRSADLFRLVEAVKPVQGEGPSIIIVNVGEVNRYFGIVSMEGGNQTIHGFGRNHSVEEISSEIFNERVKHQLNGSFCERPVELASVNSRFCEHNILGMNASHFVDSDLQ